MAKFIYRMQSILNIKYKLEEQARVAYGNASNKLRMEEEKLALLEDRKENYQKALFHQLSECLVVRDIKQGENALEIIKVSVKYQKLSVVQAERELELARIKLNEVMVERKAHEKLREHAFDNFVKELNAAEQKEIDERVSYGYNNTTDSEEK